jgi:hypothetical protein
MGYDGGMSNATISVDDFAVTFEGAWMTTLADHFEPDDEPNVFPIRHNLYRTAAGVVPDSVLTAALDTIALECFGQPLERSVFSVVTDDDGERIIRLKPGIIIAKQTIINTAKFLERVITKGQYDNRLEFMCAFQLDAVLWIRILENAFEHGTVWETHEDIKASWRLHEDVMSDIIPRRSEDRQTWCDPNTQSAGGRGSR